MFSSFDKREIESESMAHLVPPFWVGQKDCNSCPIDINPSVKTRSEDSCVDICKKKFFFWLP